MTTAGCGHPNRPGLRFCEQCGVPLPRTCPHCGAELGASARFCGGCGRSLDPQTAPPPPADPRAYTPPHLARRILRDRAALEGERRTVTVLFADAVGSTPIAARIGEEEMYALMQGCFARMLEAVHHASPSSSASASA